MKEIIKKQENIMMRIIVEIILVKAQSDKQPKKKKCRMKLWQKREAMLKSSPIA